MNGLPARYGDRRHLHRRRHVQSGNITGAAHDPQMPANLIIMADIEIVELVQVIVGHQPSHLLEIVRLELDAGRCGIAKRLLPTRYERLNKQAAGRLPSDEPQASGALCQTENFIWLRCSQPLEVGMQFAIERVMTVLERVHAFVECGLRRFQSNPAILIESTLLAAPFRVP